MGVLKMLTISDEHYQKIGRVSVAASILEARLKSFPVVMTRPALPAGWAFTAHMNVRSLCDMTKAMAREMYHEDFANEVVSSLNAAQAAYDRRSELIHYTYQPGMNNDAHGYRMMARERIKHLFKDFTLDELQSILNALTLAYNGVEECAQALHLLRGKRSPPPLGTRIHNLFLLANQQKP